jgi:peptide-methionine (S)-S-oxide reductase
MENDMFKPKSKTAGKALGILPTAALACSISSAYAAGLPDPAYDEALARPGAAPQTIVLSGGCFWGVQAVFQHVKGVKTAISGYAGGDAKTAHYDIVSTGATGHAESVEVTYDPSQVTLGTLLKVFFAVAHDPTELNRQGPDHGTQYRSAIFFTAPEQQKVAEGYIAQLDKAGAFGKPIVTQVGALAAFYPAEDYHQNYATLHPDNPYIAINDLPKVANLQKEFPDLYMKR